MDYTLLHGTFHIRYPDLPNSGPQPDGDTIKFLPTTPSLVQNLGQISGFPPNINRRGISVRLEAIDALETHFNEMHQELKGANAARDELLRRLGFTGVKFFENKPNNVEFSDQASLPGMVLSNGIDSNGRMIGFVYDEATAQALFGTAADGATVTVDRDIIDQSMNAQLLADGHVYPAFYGTLADGLREHLATTAKNARAANKEIWSRAIADPDNGAAGPPINNDSIQDMVIWPKLFRRLVSYFADGGSADLDGFGEWLKADKVIRNGELRYVDGGGVEKSGRLSDVVAAGGGSLMLLARQEDIVIKPD